MKKRKNPNKIDCAPIQNPVAKFAHQFNKALVFEDKNKYRRSAKHRKQEASQITLVRVIRAGYIYAKTIHLHWHIRQDVFKRKSCMIFRFNYR